MKYPYPTKEKPKRGRPAIGPGPSKADLVRLYVKEGRSVRDIAGCFIWAGLPAAWIGTLYERFEPCCISMLPCIHFGRSARTGVALGPLGWLGRT